MAREVARDLRYNDHMRLLVIGGTKFVGRHLVECALAHGHEITLFHRGHTGKGLFDVEELFGDRDGETDVLMGREWDAVIDTCGYVPRVVEQSADALSDAVGLYCFVSTISVYAEDQPAPIPETGRVMRFEKPPESEAITGESYGPFKALCEEAVSGICGESKTLIVRPGLIVGPHDPSDRFTYWIDRFGSEKAFLLPDRRTQPIQFIDVRDLAAFTLRLVEQRTSGVFNAVGPAKPTTLGDLWDACQRNCGGRLEPIVVRDEFLDANGVQDWVDLPLLLGEDAKKHLVDIAKAIGKGMTIRPLDETLRDTLEWHRSRGSVDLKAGLSREREAELLKEWPGWKAANAAKS
ncbi:MAG TPA: NAD-dependent epimerase/dehydratase family protein [Fimbriimonadaceae bacterium]|nr:NAD-dependent epimerase/dehydratase family protein [Fimbriimonadaceae bacterium]